MEENITFPPVVETIAKTIDTYDPKGTILVIGTTNNCIRLNKNVFHEITAYGKSMDDIKLLSESIPNGEFIHWDFMNGLLPGTLMGLKFKFIISFDAFKDMHFCAKAGFVQMLIENNLEEGGILFLGGDIIEKRTPAIPSDTMTYDDYKRSFSKMVYMKVDDSSAICAISKGRSNEDESGNVIEIPPSDQLPEYWYEKAIQEIYEEAQDIDNKNSRDAKYIEPSIDTVLTWRRVKDIPGETVLELGGNFMAAIRRFEEEARGNWTYFGPRLQNLYGSAFTTNDIINFRVGAVNNYFTARNAKLTSDKNYCEWLARLYAAVYIRNHFPTESISINIFGLYYGLLTDLKTIFLTIGTKYKTIAKIRDEIDHLKGSNLADILLTGFEHTNF